MHPAHPEFVPDPALSREEMTALQDDIASAARFEDDLDFDPAVLSVAAGGQTRLDGASSAAGAGAVRVPLVAGVDQAFLDGRAVSAIVSMRDGEVEARVHAVSEVGIPYIPGLLSFREGGPILAAFEELPARPALALFDGSGRIHFRQAGLATHMGVTLDLPSVGVAKNLLCGRPREPLDGLPEGARVAIEADGDVTAPEGTVIGYALQTRQYGGGRVNPVYVSPGHRVSADTAADAVERLCAGYKLPEPTRLADRHADEVKRTLP